MADTTRNKLAAQIIKAEMLNDQDTVVKLKAELASLATGDSNSRAPEYSGYRPTTSQQHDSPWYNKRPKGYSDDRVKKFVDSNTSLSQMFVQEKSLTASDEARMFVKTSAKFSRENMDTKYFSEEIDDSQLILNKSKRHKAQGSARGPSNTAVYEPTIREHESCDRCVDRQAKHLIVDSLEYTYMSLPDTKPFLSRMNNVIIRNNDHSCDSFVSASEDHQIETEKLIESLKEAWKSKGYKCIVMETYFKNRRPTSREFISCSKHFQVHCLPIKEKHYERARMSFKQALQASEREWSMNRKLIQTDCRRIQRHLPKGLSYFWVCFDDLKNGFGHVIETEQEFSRYFGLEVLSGLLDKDFNTMKLNQREEFKEQFERSRDFKLLYSEYRR